MSAPVRGGMGGLSRCWSTAGSNVSGQ